MSNKEIHVTSWDYKFATGTVCLPVYLFMTQEENICYTTAIQRLFFGNF